MSNSTAVTQTTNIVPVQGVFAPEPTFALQYFVGPAGTPFLPPTDPNISGATITNSTIDSTVIGGTTPAAGNFTNIAATTGQITNAPVADTDIANKGYVDSVAQGLDVKASCVYSTTGNITLSGLGTQAGGDWPVSLTAGDRVLVKNQGSSQFNGIYIAAAGPWSRSADMNVWSEVPSAFTFIEAGTTLADTGWVCTANQGGTIDVTAMPWSQFSGAGTYLAGNGLSLTGNTFAVVANGSTLNVSSSGVKISDTYPGQTSITTLGTISTGVWNGTDIAVADGGTGASDAANARANLSAAVLGANNDITSMSGITGPIASPTYIQFTTTDGTPTAVAGRLYWDVADGAKTLSLVMDNTGVIQQIGEETYYRVKASSAITNGQVVMKTGSVGNSGVLTAAPATGLQPNETDHILGLATQDISNGSFGYVTYFGVVRGINTTGGAEAWVDGQVLYYNPAVTGGLTKNKPSIPNAIVIVGIVINAASNGSIFVRPVYGSVLGGTDGNVSFSTLSDGDVIVYQDGGNGYWKNVTQSTLSVGYATSAGSAGSATTATTATNLAGGTTGSLAYQSAAGTTTFLGLGTANYVLTAGASAPQYVAQSTLSVGSATTAGTATNLAGGAAASIPYQSAAGTTAFLASAAGDAGKVLTSNGTSAPTWTTPTAYATVTDDTTTNATRYPLFANQTTGNLTTEFTSSTKLQFNPSTGIFTATGFSGSGANLTNLPAGELSGTIPSAVLGNSTVYIGTTGIVLNRASASQSLTGVSIDGSAGSATTATTATNANNVAVTDNTTTNSDYYLTYVTNTTGNLPITVASTKLKFNPSTGVITATGGAGGGTF